MEFQQNKPAYSVSLSHRSDFGLYGLCQKKNVIARKRIWDINWHNDWAEQTSCFKISKNIKITISFMVMLQFIDL